MILAPLWKHCDVCDGIMHLMWSDDTVNWQFAIEHPPESDDVELILKCKTCGHVGDIYGNDEAVKARYHKIRFGIIRTMVEKGLYKWQKR